MAYDLDPSLEDEINAAEVAVVDVLEVDFGDGVVKYWSTHHVDPMWFTSLELAGLQPLEFTPIIMSMGDISWELGPTDSSLAMTLSDIPDSDGELGELSQLTLERGIDIFSGAHIRAYRLFPNVRQGFMLWSGYGRAPKWFPNHITWDVNFLPNSLMQGIGRSYQFTCSHLYAEGGDCSYNLSRGRGLPDDNVGMKLTAGSGTSRVVLKGSGFSGLGVDMTWFAVDRTSNTYARVVAYIDDTTINIQVVATGQDGTGSLSSGDVIILGPPVTSCGKTVADCKKNGRFGAHDGDFVGVGDKRREFGGNPEASRVEYKGHIPSERGRFGMTLGAGFTRIPQANLSLHGTMLPIVFGFYRLKDISSLHWAPAGRFQHGMFYVCEAQVFDIRNPLINRIGPDTGGVDRNNLYDVVPDDAYVKWGTWFPGGIEDWRLVKEEATVDHIRRIRRGVGLRTGVYVRAGNLLLDSYGIGIGNDSEGDSHPCGSPYLFNSANGDGTSGHGIAAVRVRVDTDDDNVSVLSGSFDISAMLCELPQGIDPDLLIDPYSFDLTAEGTTIPYTRYPCIAGAVYNLFRDPRWGGGLSEERFLLSSVKSAIEYNYFPVSDSEGNTAIVTGNIHSTPWTSSIPQGARNNWVISLSVVAGQNAFHGRLLRIRDTDDNIIFSARIESSQSIGTEVSEEEQEYLSGITGATYNNFEGTFDTAQGTIFFIDQEFPEGIPQTTTSSGQYLEISPPAAFSRWIANGALVESEPVGEVCADLLEEGAMNYRMSTLGKIEFLVRRQMTESELDDVVADRLFTDRGDNRNIVRDDTTGETSLNIWQKDERELANEYNVEFADIRRNFQSTRVSVFSEEAQRKAAILFGEAGGRRKIKKTVQLRLTTSVGQAARRLALMIREDFIANLYCEFKASLKTASMVQPGDLIALDSDRFKKFKPTSDAYVAHPATGAFFFRVLKKKQSSPYVFSFECQLHLNDIYDDGTRMFGDFFVTEPTNVERDIPPLPVVPSTPTESHELNSSGGLDSFINIEITYPELE